MYSTSRGRPGRRILASILMLAVILTSTVGVVAADIGEPPTVGPAGHLPMSRSPAVSPPPSVSSATSLARTTCSPLDVARGAEPGLAPGIVDYAYELQRTPSGSTPSSSAKSTMGLPQIYMVITARTTGLRSRN